MAANDKSFVDYYEMLRVSDAAQTSGLSEHVCLAMLQGLERAGLMTQADSDRFVRRRLELT